MSGWDVFVSHCHSDEAAAAAVTEALSAAGLRVFRAVGGVETFDSISATVLDALRDSRVLLACYSAEYPTRPACQHEFAVAYLAGEAEGDPLRRVVAVNLARTHDHVEPRQLRDALLPTGPLTEAVLRSVVTAVAARVAVHENPIGEVATRQPRWLDRQVDPAQSFVGRWRELWALHSALHPTATPLTSRPSPPLVVLHGPAGIGKTALAAEYARLFGAAFPDGIAWQPTTRAPSGRSALWVMDDATGDPDSVAAALPPPGTPCLVLTRDPHLVSVGTPLALADLPPADSALLPGTDPRWAGRVHEATEGSPRLRHQVTALAANLGLAAALRRLYAPAGELLRPLVAWLGQELAIEDQTTWDVCRVLAAASPLAVPLQEVAEIIAATDALPVLHRAVRALLAGGVLVATDTMDLRLSTALALALRHADPDPARADRLRAATVRALATRHAEPWRSARPPNPDERELRAAARKLRIELTTRVTAHPLPPDQGSLRSALSSLYKLSKLTRKLQADLPPSANRQALDDLATHLRDEVLRPLLTRWHPHLPKGTNEQTWPHQAELRAALTALPAKTTLMAEALKHLEEPPN